jgi:hypothetical protein
MDRKPSGPRSMLVPNTPLKKADSWSALTSSSALCTRRKKEAVNGAWP